MLGEAAAGFEIVFYKVIDGIIRFAGAQHRHEMIVSPSQAAGAFQLALVHHKSTNPGFSCGQCGAASRRAAAEDEQIRERTLRAFLSSDSFVFFFINAAYSFHKIL